MADSDYRRLAAACACGSVFEPKDKRQIYCTKRCKVSAWRTANPDRYRQLSAVGSLCQYVANACASCGKAWGSRRKWEDCDACANARRLAQEKARGDLRSLAKHREAAAQTTCRLCGLVFCFLYRSWGRRDGGVCQVCEPEAKRLMVRAAKTRRKARERASAAETVYPHKVFARDGWRCKLCGIETPKAKRGTHEHDAPELDHIVPLAQGGPHTYANTQCACRSCNQLKSDRTPDQMWAELLAA